MFLVWLGEQITARGIGNGSSLIIFAGIVAEMPTALSHILEQGRSGVLSPAVIIVLLAVMIGIVTMVVFFERAQRRLTIQYPKRQIGNRMFQGDSSHLPLKLNASGVIPPIFASTLLYLPATAQQFLGTSSDEVSRILALLGPGQPLHILLYVALIVFFSFFYTPIVIPPRKPPTTSRSMAASFRGTGLVRGRHNISNMYSTKSPWSVRLTSPWSAYCRKSYPTKCRLPSLLAAHRF